MDLQIAAINDVNFLHGAGGYCVVCLREHVVWAYTYEVVELNKPCSVCMMCIHTFKLAESEGAFVIKKLYSSFALEEVDKVTQIIEAFKEI